MGFFISIIGACLFAEVYGYFLHILLHSDRVEWLSRSHMIHHLKIYKPMESLRPSEKYLISTEKRFSFADTGVEWVVPIGFVLGLWFLAFWYFDVRWYFQMTFSVFAVGWGFLMFSYMHDSMHLKNFWMENNRFLRNWYLKIRKLHDIHHRELSDEGRMIRNFGICFFFCDRIFGSISTRPTLMNQVGIKAAYKRYSYIDSPQ